MSDPVPFYIVSDAEWEAYKTKFNKHYPSNEEANRRAEWEKTIAEVNKHNHEYFEGKHTYTQAVNQFADGSKPSFGLSAHLN